MRKKKFVIVILSYILAWLVVTIVVCSILWNKLSKYENNYNKALEAANPDLYMPTALNSLSINSIDSVVENSKLTVSSRYENLDDYKKFFRTCVEGKVLTWERDAQKFSELRPVYDIYINNKLFAVLSLTSDGNVDSFGFNKWKIKDIALSENNYEYHEVYLKVSDDATLTINGVEVAEEDIVHTADIENEVTDKAYELSGVKHGYKVVYAGNLIKTPTIKVADASGTDISEQFTIDEQGVHDYFTVATQDFIDTVQPTVEKLCHTYIKHIYKKAYLYQVTALMVPGSAAEKLIKSVQSALYYGWVPKDYKFIEEKYDDFIVYDENYFSCRSTFKIERWDKTRRDEEDFSCQWLFQKVKGKWLATFFVLN